MKLNGKIRMFRESMGLTQKELAEKIGISEKAVSSWEVGAATPRMGMMQALADVFGVRMVDLLSDSTTENDFNPDLVPRRNHPKSVFDRVTKDLNDFDDMQLKRLISYAQKLIELHQILKEGEEDDNL